MKKFKSRPIYQYNTDLKNVTGIQKVMMDIQEALRELNIKVVGDITYDEIAPSLGVKESEYIKKNNFRIFRNSVVIIHERRLFPVFWILNKIFRYNIVVVYIHHNELYGYRWLPIFPKHIVAISDGGIKNLTEYFRLPISSITKIHNCVRDTNIKFSERKKYDSQNIQVLYPARIHSVKQQVALVEYLKGRLDKRIKILFAGEGPEYNRLKEVCEGSDQFIPLGFREDVLDLLQESDFMLLFSKHEGLPISLIEADMVGTPIICNSVGGNTEIAEHNRNAFVVDSWQELLSTLNSLTSLSCKQYEQMGREGKKIYQERYVFQKFKKEYMSYFRTLVKS